MADGYTAIYTNCMGIRLYKTTNEHVDEGIISKATVRVSDDASLCNQSHQCIAPADSVISKLTVTTRPTSTTGQ